MMAGVVGAAGKQGDFSEARRKAGEGKSALLS